MKLLDDISTQIGILLVPFFFNIDKEIGIQISILGNITSQSLVHVRIIKGITKLNSVCTAILQNITFKHSLKY